MVSSLYTSKSTEYVFPKISIKFSGSISPVQNPKIISRYSKERLPQLPSLFKFLSKISFQKEEEKEQSKKI